MSGEGRSKDRIYNDIYIYIICRAPDPIGVVSPLRLSQQRLQEGDLVHTFYNV